MLVLGASGGVGSMIVSLARRRRGDRVGPDRLGGEGRGHRRAGRRPGDRRRVPMSWPSRSASSSRRSCSTRWATVSWPRSLEAIAPRGRIVSFGISAGAEVTFNLQIAVPQDGLAARLRRACSCAARSAGPGSRRRCSALADGSIRVRDRRRAPARRGQRGVRAPASSAASRATCCSTSADRARAQATTVQRKPIASAAGGSGLDGSPGGGLGLVEAARAPGRWACRGETARPGTGPGRGRAELELAAAVGADPALGAVVVGVAQLPQAADPRRLDVDHPGRERQRLDVGDRVDRGVPGDPVVVVGQRRPRSPSVTTSGSSIQALGERLEHAAVEHRVGRLIDDRAV